MNAIAESVRDIGKPFRPAHTLPGVARTRAQRLRVLLGALLDGMNAATPDVAPEFHRFPFP